MVLLLTELKICYRHLSSQLKSVTLWKLVSIRLKKFVLFSIRNVSWQINESHQQRYNYSFIIVF